MIVLKQFSNFQIGDVDAVNLILRWEIDPKKYEKKLFMQDVDPNDVIYNQKGIICQFPRTNTDCYCNSNEGNI